MTKELIKKGEVVNNPEEFLATWTKDQLLPDSEVVLSALTALETLDYEVTYHDELKHLTFAQVVYLLMQMEAQKEAISKILRTAHFEERLNPLYSEINKQAGKLMNSLSYGDILSKKALKTTLELIHDGMKKEPDAIADFWSESSNAVIYPISQIKILSKSQISVPYVGIVDLEKMPDLTPLMYTIAIADFVGIQRVGDGQTFRLFTVKKKGLNIVEMIRNTVRKWPDPATRPPLVVVGMDYQVRGAGVIRAFQMSLENEYVEDAKFGDMEQLFIAETVEEAIEKMKKLNEERRRCFFVIKENLDLEKMVEDAITFHGLLTTRFESEGERVRKAWDRYSEFINQCTDEKEDLFAVILTLEESAPTSLMCSHCGHKKKASEDYQSKFKCSKCGMKKDRDVNAAINIVKLDFEMIQDRMRWFHNAEKGATNPNRCSTDPKEVHVGYLAPHIPRLVDIQMKHPNGENGEVSLLPIKSVKQRNEYDTIDLHFTAEEDIPERDKETEPLDLRFTPEEDLPKRGENPETVKISPLKHTRPIVPPGVPEPEWLKDDTTA